MSDMPSESSDRASHTPHGRSGAELSDMYPMPKTYEQRTVEKNERELRMIARQPRHLALSIAVRLFLIVGAAALLIALTPGMIFFNVIAGVFLVALLVIILLGVSKWQAGEVSDVLYQKGLNGNGFLTFYMLVLAPIMGGALYLINTRTQGIYLFLCYVILFLVHLFCIQWSLRRMGEQ